MSSPTVWIVFVWVSSDASPCTAFMFVETCYKKMKLNLVLILMYEICVKCIVKVYIKLRCQQSGIILLHCVCIIYHFELCLNCC